MTFYGKPPDRAAPASERTFAYSSSSGQRREVQATYVQFYPAHVSFWLENDTAWDTLVIAEANHEVNDLKEMP